MTRKIFALLFATLLSSFSISSQNPAPAPSQNPEPAGEPGLSWFKKNHVFDGLDAAFTLGTAGLGVELSTPVTRWTRVRAGFEGMPGFHVPIDFPVSTYAAKNVEGSFDRIKDLMYKITGDEMRDEVTVVGKPRLVNFKFLVDVFPFQTNRHWHVTAGFYWGPKKIATALNDVESTSTLVAMNIYNRFYDRLQKYPYTDEPFYGDVYLSEETYNKFMDNGKVGIYLGDRKDGTPYYLEPESNGTVSARAIANAFKPYLGFGYSGAIDKSKRWNVGVEAGVLFWGGAPQIILNDGVNLNKDLVNVRGKVGDYLDLMKALPVYPTISFKLSYTIF